MGCCPVHCRMSSNIPNFYLINASGDHPLTQSITKNVSRYCRLSPRDQTHSTLRTNTEGDGLVYPSLLSSCISRDLDLWGFICSHLHVILLDPQIYFPLVVWLRHYLRLNSGLACWCLCPGLDTFASALNHPWIVGPIIQRGFPANYTALWQGNDLISGEL